MSRNILTPARNKVTLYITGAESNQKALRTAIVEYMKQHEENLPEDYLEKSNRVWAIDVEISAAADFLQVLTSTHSPQSLVQTERWHGIKYHASCMCDDQQLEYNAIYLDQLSGNHYNCVKSLSSVQDLRTGQTVVSFQL